MSGSFDTGDTEDDPLARHLRAMSARFERGLGERAAHLRRTADAWEAGEDAGREGLRVAAHRLKGIAGSCGHADLGQRAAEVEQAAKAEDGGTAIPGARALADEADQRAARALALEPVSWVVVLQPDEELRELTERALARVDDLDATVVGSLGAALEALESARECGAILVPTDAPASDAARLREVGRVVWLGDAGGGQPDTEPRVTVGAGPGGLADAARAAVKAAS